MFNLFKKHKTTTTEPPTTLAAITYYIDQDLDLKIDINLKDYDDQSINALSIILKTLANDLFFIETVQFLKTGLSEEQREDLIVKVLMPIAIDINQKMTKINSEVKKNKPCIKPSDLHK